MIKQELQQPSTSEAVLVQVHTEKKTEPLVVGSLYRIPSATSINQMDEIEKTLDSNDIAWIGTDLNLPDIKWKDQCVFGKNYPHKISNSFLNKVNDLGLHHIDDRPSRGGTILDIYLTNRKNLVTRNSIMPCLGDHDIAFIDSRIKAVKRRPIARKISIWKTTDCAAIREDTDTFGANFETDCNNQSVEQMWQSEHQHLTTMVEKRVQTPQPSTTHHGSTKT